MEPLLYAYSPPRTISATLTEYAEHLQKDRGFSAARVRATLRSLERLLDPVEAPIAALTPALARTLAASAESILDEAGEPEPFAPDPSTRCLAVLRARRFFRFALERGYVRTNPFDDLPVAAPAAPRTDYFA